MDSFLSSANILATLSWSMLCNLGWIFSRAYMMYFFSISCGIVSLPATVYSFKNIYIYWSTIKIPPSRESRHFPAQRTWPLALNVKKLLISQALCISTQIIFKRVLTHRQSANIKNTILLFVCPSSFSWDFCMSQEKIKTRLMQNSGGTNRVLWYFWIG